MRRWETRPAAACTSPCTLVRMFVEGTRNNLRGAGTCGRRQNVAELAKDPQGFLLRTDVLTLREEAALLAFIRDLPFGEVHMHGVAAKRRVAQFGWRFS